MLRHLASNWRVAMAFASSAGACSGAAISECEQHGHESAHTRAVSARRSVAARLASLEARMAKFDGSEQKLESPGRMGAKHLVAETFNSGFPAAHDTYNGMAVASDGNVYYVLCSEEPDVAGQVYRLCNDHVEHIADLDVVCGSGSVTPGVNGINRSAGDAQRQPRVVAQGKSHVPFFEDTANRTLHFATHVGWYADVDNMEVHPDKPELLPPGLGPYPGGYFLELELASGRINEVGAATKQHEKSERRGLRLGGEGVLAYNIDIDPTHTRLPRGFALTWPHGRFVTVELESGIARDHGLMSGGAEGVHPRTGQYRTICRSIAVDPRNGNAYFTNAEGNIMRYDPTTDSVTCLREPHLRLDYFGTYDPSSAGSMGYNWRQLVWVPELQAFAGVHGNSGYLFIFRPPITSPASPDASPEFGELNCTADVSTGILGENETGSIELIDRITSASSKRCGMFDQFSYGYLGFALGPDGHTLYYLTGGPIYRSGRRVEGERWIPRGASKGDENLHLVTYDLRTSKYIDHGPICYGAKQGSSVSGQSPSYVNSIAVDAEGSVYSMGRMTDEKGHTRTDLFRVSTSQIHLS